MREFRDLPSTDLRLDLIDDEDPDTVRSADWLHAEMGLSLSEISDLEILDREGRNA